MKRLFWGIGIDLAAKIEVIEKTKISAKKKGLDIRWLPLENHHVTLCFLGDVEEENIETMLAKVKGLAADFHRFDLKLKGAGAFPEVEHGRVIYIGVQAKNELVELQAALKELLIDEGFDLSEREYRPHVTLGRLKNKKNLRDVLSPMTGKDFGKTNVKEIVLFESSFDYAFPKYTAIERIPLQKDI